MAQKYFLQKQRSFLVGKKKNPSSSKNRLKIIQEKCRWTKGQSSLSSVTPVLYHKEVAQGVRREKASESFKGKEGVLRGLLPKNSPGRRGPHTTRAGHGCTRDAAEHHTAPVLSSACCQCPNQSWGNNTASFWALCTGKFKLFFIMPVKKISLYY